jgi:hypothetical protein
MGGGATAMACYGFTMIAKVRTRTVDTVLTTPRSFIKESSIRIFDKYKWLETVLFGCSSKPGLSFSL